MSTNIYAIFIKLTNSNTENILHQMLPMPKYKNHMRVD